MPSASGREPTLGKDVLELDMLQLLVRKCRDGSGWPGEGREDVAGLRDHVFKGVWRSSKEGLKDGQDTMEHRSAQD